MQFFFACGSLPEAATIAADTINEIQPQAVIAADRGGRLLALMTHHAWGLRYPSQRFPTADHKIHFARITRRVEPSEFYRVMDYALEQAGLSISPIPTGEAPEPKRLVFIDDRTGSGSTARNLARRATNYGVSPDNVMLLTLRTEYHDPGSIPSHVVVDPEHQLDPADWIDCPAVIGVDYKGSGGTKPEVVSSVVSRQARRDLYQKLAPIEPR